jgi:hypothetical protein
VLYGSALAQPDMDSRCREPILILLRVGQAHTTIRNERLPGL